MTLADKALSFAGTTGTVLANFWPWILAAFLLGGVLSGYGTFQVTRAFYQRATLKAEANLANFRGDLATAAANGQAEARRQSEAAYTAMDQWRQGIESRLDTGFASIANQWGRDVAKLRESINAPIYDCLRIPYPADALRLLNRPGGTVPAGDSANPGTATPAGGVP